MDELSETGQFCPQNAHAFGAKRANNSTIINRAIGAENSNVCIKGPEGLALPAQLAAMLD